MYSERGQLTLAHTDATVRSFRQRAEVNKHFGGRTEMIDRQQIRELVPSLNLDPGHLPVLAGSGTSTAPPRATTPWPGVTPSRRPSAAWRSINSPKFRT
jgi:glycine/D-amino acid oxidase-like deaminating enzyme